jgi:sialate O-acetylesterase
LGAVPVARADVRLPAVFSDHMVLQQGALVPVWGWAAAGEEVTVSIAGQAKKASANAEGKWSLKLDPLAAGGPLTLTVQGANMLAVKDVLVGEVWLGSGQSNMAMTVNRALNFEEEKSAAHLPQVRMFTVARGASAKAKDDCQGSWVVCTPETVGLFSATAYFFGRELHKTLGTPVGLINSSVGGTPIESWISPEAQHASAELKPFFEAQAKEDAKFDPVAAKAQYEKALVRWQEAVAKAKAAGQPLPRKPQDPVAVRARKGDVGGLFNGMIAPLIPYALRGVIWYQGEANTAPTKSQFYQHQLPLLVKDWRSRWGQGEMPFGWVQLPNYEASARDWPIVQEAMLKSLSVPNTGMAITIDIGEAKDIHPKNKQDVGKRLSLWALATVYGKDVPSSGPLPEALQVRGREAVVSFKHAYEGLAAKGDELKGFEIAGADGAWHPGQARIEGSQVVVVSPTVASPAAVRYAWDDNPVCNLYNGAGLPASPFRLNTMPK